MKVYAVTPKNMPDKKKVASLVYGDLEKVQALYKDYEIKEVNLEVKQAKKGTGK